MQYSVIVPMGRPERAAPTLESFQAQNWLPPAWELIAVGQGASAVTASFPELPIRAIDLPRRMLPGETRAQGIAQAKGSWLLLVDDDILLDPNFFRVLDEKIRSEEAAAAEANANDPKPRSLGAIGARIPGATGTFFERLTDITNFWTQQGSLPLEDVPWLYSAAIAVRAEAYHAIGGFDCALAIGEDLDLTRRLVEAGWRNCYHPALIARHNHRRTTLRTMLRYFWQNGDIARYYGKRFPSVRCFSFKTALGHVRRALRQNRRVNAGHYPRYWLHYPGIFLNTLVYQLSIEWHYQRHIYRDGRFLTLDMPCRGDRACRRAFQALQNRQYLTFACLYGWAMIRDLFNTERR